MPLSPAYSATILAWVEAGGVYAVANLRGGSEEGEQWHRDGMRGNKQNTFDDFHAAAECLIANNVTTTEQLTISGGSNGGLLVGAALTQRPDLYSAVICAAPLARHGALRGARARANLVRRVRHRQRIAEEFGWLLRVLPVPPVSTTASTYPAVLFTVFDGDSRVDPLHARKMAAALQHGTLQRTASAGAARV